MMIERHPDWQIDPLKGAWWLTAFFTVLLWIEELHLSRLLCLLGKHDKVEGMRHTWCSRCSWGYTQALR